MVLHVVLFELLVVGRQAGKFVSPYQVSKFANRSLLMVKEVMGQIVANVPKDSTTEHSHRGVPIVEEYCVGELVERRCEGKEESWWHD